MGMGNVCHTFGGREPASGHSGEHKKGAAIIPIAVTSLAITRGNDYGKEKRIKYGDYADASVSFRVGMKTSADLYHFTGAPNVLLTT